MPAGSESGPLPSTAAQRLDGWKEIAAYLRRDVRTAKRWERTRNLPVHRLPGGPKFAVYAIQTELELWSQSAGGEPAGELPPRNALAVSKSARWFGGVAAFVTVAAIGLWIAVAGPAMAPR